MSLPTPFYEADGITIFCGDAKSVLSTLPDESINCCVTSPPYFGLRDYGMAGQIGLEATPEEYVASLVAVFREVKRVLRVDGTLWLNLGDCFSTGSGGDNGNGTSTLTTNRRDFPNAKSFGANRKRKNTTGLPAKNMIGIPWRVAFALQADGWILRQDIIWAKPNPMPESVTDRCTKSHEYIFMLSKSERYHYDHEAIKEPPSPELVQQIEEGYNGKALKDYLGASVQDASATKSRIINGYRSRIDKQRGHSRRHSGFNDKWDALTPTEQAACGSNKRDVWTVAPANYKDAHFATFPPDLIKPCVLAGCPVGGVVLDPFLGSGTTAMVAVELGRKCVGIELNPDYAAMAVTRSDVTKGLPL